MASKKWTNQQKTGVATSGKTPLEMLARAEVRPMEWTLILIGKDMQLDQCTTFCEHFLLQQHSLGAVKYAEQPTHVIKEATDMEGISSFSALITKLRATKSRMFTCLIVRSGSDQNQSSSRDYEHKFPRCQFVSIAYQSVMQHTNVLSASAASDKRRKSLKHQKQQKTPGIDALVAQTKHLFISNNFGKRHSNNKGTSQPSNDGQLFNQLMRSACSQMSVSSAYKPTNSTNNNGKGNTTMTFANQNHPGRPKERANAPPPMHVRELAHICEQLNSEQNKELAMHRAVQCMCNGTYMQLAIQTVKKPAAATKELHAHLLQFALAVIDHGEPVLIVQDLKQQLVRCGLLKSVIEGSFSKISSKIPVFGCEEYNRLTEQPTEQLQYFQLQFLQIHEVSIILDSIAPIVDQSKSHVQMFKDSVSNFTTDQMSISQFRVDSQAPSINQSPLSICDLPIVPSVADLIGAAPSDLPQNIVDGPYDNHDHYLNTQFTLMREDLVAPLRDAIKLFLESKPWQKQHEQLAVTNVKFVNETLDPVNGALIKEIEFRASPTANFSNRLTQGNLVCLSDDQFKMRFWFGIVANNERLPMGYGSKKRRMSLSMISCGGLDRQSEYVMVESPAFYVAYKHVLHSLKHMAKWAQVPMQRYLVDCNTDVRDVQYLQRNSQLDLGCLLDAKPLIIDVMNESEWPSCVELGLDESQYLALKMALTKELSIIQGPPGTGKTYIGTAITKTLVHNRLRWDPERKHPILLACYTNHALDQFLEKSLQFTKSVIRVGSRSVNEWLTHHNLNTVRRLYIQIHNLHPDTRDVLNRWYSTKPAPPSPDLFNYVQLVEKFFKKNAHIADPALLTIVWYKFYDAVKLIDFTGLSCFVPQICAIPNFVNHNLRQVRDRLKQLEAELHLAVHYTEADNALKLVSCDLIKQFMPQGLIWQLSDDTKLAEWLKPTKLNNRSVEQLQMKPYMIRYLMKECKKDEDTVKMAAALCHNHDLNTKSYLENNSPTKKSVKAACAKAPVNKWPSLHKLDSLCKLLKQYLIEIDSPEQNSSEIQLEELLLYADCDLDKVKLWLGAAPDEDESEKTDAELNNQVYQEVYANTRMLDDEQNTDVHYDAAEAARIVQTAYEPVDVKLGANMNEHLNLDNRDRRDAHMLKVSSAGNRYRTIGLFSRLILGVTAMSDTEYKHKLTQLESGQENMNDMRLSERWAMYQYWVQAYKAKLPLLMKQRQAEYDIAQAYLKQAKDVRDYYLLQMADIVGMTTTGAATYQALLQRVKPGILIVEEAAEVFESHLVSSLNMGCQQMILIGDHQQLRPSPACYALEKKGLDISLFERLVMCKFDHVTLRQQHRMRPEISRIMSKHFYEKLLDHPSVLQYPKVPGMNANMLFIAHSVSETTTRDSYSFSNKHEADWAVAIAQHIGRQGVLGSSVTILCTYVAQVTLIRKLLAAAYPNGPKPLVKAVDNYQGEENEYVILTLVRSNAKTIGFLKTKNRICVALSRARHGQYILGNMDCLSGMSQLWTDIHQTLITDAAMFTDCCPIVCERHHKVQMVKAPKDFVLLAPDGGCKSVCGSVMECGHECALPCHGWDLQHKDTAACKLACARVCTECGVECSSTCGKCHPSCVPCTNLVDKQLPCGHTVPVECSQDVISARCSSACDKVLDCGHLCPVVCAVSHDCVSQARACLHKVTVQLPCTHPFELACCELKTMTDLGSIDCEQKVKRVLPVCKHELKVKCAVGPESLTCDTPCKHKLPCGHVCQGSCEKCLQGRLHAICTRNHPTTSAAAVTSESGTVTSEHLATTRLGLCGQLETFLKTKELRGNYNLRLGQQAKQNPEQIQAIRECVVKLKWLAQTPARTSLTAAKLRSWEQLFCLIRKQTENPVFSMELQLEPSGKLYDEWMQTCPSLTQVWSTELSGQIWPPEFVRCQFLNVTKWLEWNMAKMMPDNDCSAQIQNVQDEFTRVHELWKVLREASVLMQNQTAPSRKQLQVQTQALNRLYPSPTMGVCGKVLVCGHRCSTVLHGAHSHDCSPCTHTFIQQLPCAHSVQLTCLQRNTVKDSGIAHVCPKKVKFVLPLCGHEVEVSCGTSAQSLKCEAPCNCTLPCRHICQGTCGACSHGAAHVPCSQCPKTAAKSAVKDTTRITPKGKNMFTRRRQELIEQMNTVLQSDHFIPDTAKPNFIQIRALCDCLRALQSVVTTDTSSNISNLECCQSIFGLIRAQTENPVYRMNLQTASLCESYKGWLHKCPSLTQVWCNELSGNIWPPQFVRDQFLQVANRLKANIDQLKSGKQWHVQIEQLQGEFNTVKELYKVLVNACSMMNNKQNMPGKTQCKMQKDALNRLYPSKASSSSAAEIDRLTQAFANQSLTDTATKANTNLIKKRPQPHLLEEPITEQSSKGMHKPFGDLEKHTKGCTTKVTTKMGEGFGNINLSLTEQLQLKIIPKDKSLDKTKNELRPEQGYQKQPVTTKAVPSVGVQQRLDLDKQLTAFLCSDALKPNNDKPNSVQIRAIRDCGRKLKNILQNSNGSDKLLCCEHLFRLIRAQTENPVYRMNLQTASLCESYKGWLHKCPLLTQVWCNELSGNIWPPKFVRDQFLKVANGLEVNMSVISSDKHWKQKIEIVREEFNTVKELHKVLNAAVSVIHNKCSSPPGPNALEKQKMALNRLYPKKE